MVVTMVVSLCEAMLHDHFTSPASWMATVDGRGVAT